MENLKLFLKVLAKAVLVLLFIIALVRVLSM